MSYEKFMASYQKLNRDMTQCEKLAKLIGGKMEAAKQLQRSNSDATKKSTSSSSRPPAVLHKRSSSSTGRPAHERTGTVKKSTDTLVKTRSVEGVAGKLSSIANRGSVEGCKCRTQPSRSTTSHSVFPVKPSSSMPPPPPLLKDQKPHPKSPIRRKHLSWGEILSQNHDHKAKSSRQDSKGVRSRSAATLKTTATYDSKHPHDCAGPVMYRHNSGDAHNSHSYHAPPPHAPPVSSLSSEESSGFSSNTDVPLNVTNKSVQCGLPLHEKFYSKPRQVSVSTSSGASCRMDDDEEKGLLASDAHTVFNPLRTLNFLTRELHGRLLNAPIEDRSAHRIVAEMQRVLEGLSEENIRAHSSKRSHFSGSSQSLDSAQGSSETQLPKRPLGINEAEKDIIMQTLASYPNLAKKIEEKTKSLSKKIFEVNPQMPVPVIPEVVLSTTENIQFYQKYIEVSCEHLGKMTDVMEKACEDLKKEKEALQSAVHSKQEELESLKKREQDYMIAINTLRRNLESLTLREKQLVEDNKKLRDQAQVSPSLPESVQRMHLLSTEVDELRTQMKEIPDMKALQTQVKDLTAENEKLREEVKVLPGLKFIEEKYQGMAAVNCKLVEENKRLQASLEAMRRQKALGGEGCAQCLRLKRDMQTLKLEREKLLVLIESKEGELEQHHREARDIQRLVEEHLMLVKDGGRELQTCPSPPPSLDFLSSCSSMSGSGSGSGSELEEAAGGSGKGTPTSRPACSSPNASNFKVVDEGWENISTILPEGARSISEALVSLPSRDPSAETFKSLNRDRDSWHTLVSEAQGDGSSSESQQHRRHMSVQRSKEWLRDQQAVQSCGILGGGGGDQRGPLTKDLRKTLQQLLKIVQKQQQRPQDQRQTGDTQSEPSRTVQEGSGRVLRVEMPVLPSPPKFLDPPEFSDFSSIGSSHADLRSVEVVPSSGSEDDHRRGNKE